MTADMHQIFKWLEFLIIIGMKIISPNMNKEPKNAYKMGTWHAIPIGFALVK